MRKMIIIALLGIIVPGCSKDDSEPVEDPPVVEVLGWEQLPFFCQHWTDTSLGCHLTIEVWLKNNTDEQVCSDLYAELEPDYDGVGSTIVFNEVFSLHPYQEKSVVFWTNDVAVTTSVNTTGHDTQEWADERPYKLVSEIVVLPWDCSVLFD